MFAPPASPLKKLKPGEKRGKLGRVLVVGGNGFLGHHIVNQAVETWDATVSSVDLRCDKNRNPNAAYYECDITDGPRLLSVFEDIKPDVVIHTASPLASSPKRQAMRDLFRKVNVDGTQAVVEACQHAGVKALVYTSSASVISDNKADLVNADERWPVIRGKQQTDYYTETKAAAEEVVLKANRQDPYKLLTLAIRPAGIFGEGDLQMLAGLYKAYRKGNSNIQLGDGTNIFDFTYVGNVAHAHLLAAKTLLATAAAATAPLDMEKVDGEAFFITNDAPVYFWDFARAVWRAAGNPNGTAGVWHLSRDIGSLLGVLSQTYCSLVGKEATFTTQTVTFACMTRYYNITKAKSLLRYQPLWTLQEGVDRGVKWFVEQDGAAAVKAQ